MPAGSDTPQFSTLAAIGRELSRVTTKGGATPSEVEELLSVAADLSEVDPSQLIPFIREYLLPQCVQSPSDEAEDSVRGTHLRRLLVDWLNSLPEGVLWEVRGDVLNYVLGVMSTAPTFDAIYCLASIGYRSGEAIDALKAIGQRNDRLGHEAMRLLLGFEPGAEVASWVAARVRAAQFADRTEELLSAAAQLHDIAFLNFLAADAIRRGPGWFALARLLWVGQEAQGDRHVQDAVWRALVPE